MKHPAKGILGATILLTGLTAAGIGLTTATHVMQQDTLDEVVATNIRREITRMNVTKEASQFDGIQQDLECCGSTSYKIYATMDSYRHGSVPISCCINKTMSCNQPPLEGKIYKDGCKNPLIKIMVSAIRHCTIALGLMGTAMSAVWVTFLIWFSICL